MAIGCDRRQGRQSAGTPEPALKVVLAGNIGKFSLVLRQRGESLSLQPRRVTDDDLGAAFGRWETTKVASAGPALILCPKFSARQEKEIRR